MDYFKLKIKNKKKSEEELRSSLEKHAEKEFPEYDIVEWFYDENKHECVIQMKSK